MPGNIISPVGNMETLSVGTVGRAIGDLVGALRGDGVAEGKAVGVLLGDGVGTRVGATVAGIEAWLPLLWLMRIGEVASRSVEPMSIIGAR